MIKNSVKCLCGSDDLYSSCCQPFHLNVRKPLTAELTMRSRFTAYAMKNEDYLLKTWDEITRPAEVNFAKETAEWIRLEIVKTKKGAEKDTKGVVEFKAYYIQDNEEYVMSEISRFKKTAGRWLYLDGIVKSVIKAGQDTNQGKNAPCSCGSGKKYKRCCGK